MLIIFVNVSVGNHLSIAKHRVQEEFSEHRGNKWLEHRGNKWLEHRENEVKYFQIFERILRIIFIIEINFRFIEAICKLLNIKVTFKWSSEFILAEEKTQRLVNICKDIKATDYYSGPAAKNYMDESLFNNENIFLYIIQAFDILSLRNNTHPVFKTRKE